MMKILTGTLVRILSSIFLQSSLIWCFKKSTKTVPIWKYLQKAAYLCNKRLSVGSFGSKFWLFGAQKRSFSQLGAEEVYKL